jgi:hypothetical protein
LQLVAARTIKNQKNNADLSTRGAESFKYENGQGGERNEKVEFFQLSSSGLACAKESDLSKPLQSICQ